MSIIQYKGLAGFNPRAKLFKRYTEKTNNIVFQYVYYSGDSYYIYSNEAWLQVTSNTLSYQNSIEIVISTTYSYTEGANGIKKSWMYDGTDWSLSVSTPTLEETIEINRTIKSENNNYFYQRSFSFETTSSISFDTSTPLSGLKAKSRSIIIYVYDQTISLYEDDIVVINKEAFIINRMTEEIVRSPKIRKTRTLYLRSMI